MNKAKYDARMRRYNAKVAGHKTNYLAHIKHSLWKTKMYNERMDLKRKAKDIKFEGLKRYHILKGIAKWHNKVAKMAARARKWGLEWKKREKEWPGWAEEVPIRRH